MRKKFYSIIASPLFSGSAIMIIGSNSASGLNYLYHLIVGRLLGPSLYGEFASLISILGLLGIIPAAVSLAIVKRVSSAKNDSEVNNLIKWFRSKSLIVSLIFALLMFALSPLILAFLHINKLTYILPIGLILFFALQAGFNRAILQGILKFKEIVISVLSENVSKFFVSAVLIFLGFGVGGALMAFAFASLLGLYVTNYYLRVQNKSNEQVHVSIKSMLFLTIPMLVQTVSITSIISSDVVLVKHFFSSHEAGIYAALSTLGKIIFFGAGPVVTVMFPLVSKKSSKGESYKQVLIYSFIATAFFAFGVCLFYFFAPRVAINMLFGSLYLESSSLLIWFGIFISLLTLSSLLVNFGISLGKNKITVFPLFFAFLQIILIFLFHNTLLTVVIISNIITALLLVSLLIYLIFNGELYYGKSIFRRNKVDFNNRPSF